MKPKPGDIRARILENMLLVATKKKQDVERSLVAFTEIVTNEVCNLCTWVVKTR